MSRSDYERLAVLLRESQAETRAAESRIAALTVELEQVSRSHTTVNAAWDAARADLATECAAREKANDAIEQQKAETAHAIFKLQQAERERDTALARAKEAEGDRDFFDVERMKVVEQLTAAESALASARELLSEARETMTDEEEPLRSNMDAWLSSAPSPAPCSGCAAARELLQDIADMHWGETLDARRDAVAAWLKGHGK